jgi:hypothetical protein
MVSEGWYHLEGAVSADFSRFPPPSLLTKQAIGALKGHGFSRAFHRFQEFTARLGSRALSRLQRHDFLRLMPHRKSQHNSNFIFAAGNDSM